MPPAPRAAPSTSVGCQQLQACTPGRRHTRLAARRRCATRPSPGLPFRRSTAAGAQQVAWDDGRSAGLLQNVSALYKFTRPHTMMGTFLSVCSVSVLAMHGQPWDLHCWTALCAALAAALLANVSIVGLNQCFDVELDRVNKPYLPLASGEWTMQTGWTTVLVTGTLALAVALMCGTAPLIATVAISILLGIIYSADVPFLRWKKHPVAAAACILIVRAILVQVGFWAHMQVATGARTFAPSSHLVFMTALMAFFSVVIALFKDIPDVRGDAQHDTATASVRYGVRRVFWACVWMLNAAYASAVAYIATHTSGVVRLAGLAAQIVMCLLLQRRAHMTDLDWHEDVVSAYMFVWKLFYAQYLVFPCLC